MNSVFDTDLSAVGSGREILTPATGKPQNNDTGEALLAKIASNTAAPAVPGFALPPYDYLGLTYFGSTNNIQTATYKTGGSGGTTVAVLTMTYVGAGAADNDRVASVTRT